MGAADSFSASGAEGTPGSSPHIWSHDLGPSPEEQSPGTPFPLLHAWKLQSLKRLGSWLQPASPPVLPPPSWLCRQRWWLPGAEPGWPGFADWQDLRGREQRRQRARLGQEQSKGAGGPAQARRPCPMERNGRGLHSPCLGSTVQTPFRGNKRLPRVNVNQRPGRTPGGREGEEEGGGGTRPPHWPS